MSFLESEKASIHEMQEFLLDMQGEVLGSAEVPIGHQGICCHVVKCRQKIYRVLLDMITVNSCHLMMGQLICPAAQWM